MSLREHQNIKEHHALLERAEKAEARAEAAEAALRCWSGWKDRALALEEAVRVGLAPLPPGIVAVPREVLAQVKDALKRLLAEAEGRTQDDSIPKTTAVEDGCEALAALQKVKP